MMTPEELTAKNLEIAAENGRKIEARKRAAATRAAKNAAKNTPHCRTDFFAGAEGAYDYAANGAEAQEIFDMISK